MYKIKNHWDKLKIQWTLVRTGSSPVSSTDEEKPRFKTLAFLL